MEQIWNIGTITSVEWNPNLNKLTVNFLADFESRSLIYEDVPSEVYDGYHSCVPSKAHEYYKDNIQGKYGERPPHEEIKNKIVRCSDKIKELEKQSENLNSLEKYLAIQWERAAKLRIRLRDKL